MATKISNFTTSTLSTVTVTGVPFLPTEIEIWVSDKTAGNAVVPTESYGTANGTGQMAVSTVPSTLSKSYSGECIHLRDMVNGTLSDVLVASLVSFNNNGNGDYGFTLNFTQKQAGWRVRFKVRS